MILLWVIIRYRRLDLGSSGVVSQAFTADVHAHVTKDFEWICRWADPLRVSNRAPRALHDDSYSVVPASQPNQGSESFPKRGINIYCKYLVIKISLKTIPFCQLEDIKFFNPSSVRV